MDVFITLLPSRLREKEAERLEEPEVVDDFKEVAFFKHNRPSALRRHRLTAGTGVTEVKARPNTTNEMGKWPISPASSQETV